MEISKDQKDSLKVVIDVAMVILTEDMIKQLADMVIDFIENNIKNSGTEIDDTVILPLISKVRSTFNIKDND